MRLNGSSASSGLGGEQLSQPSMCSPRTGGEHGGGGDREAQSSTNSSSTGGSVCSEWAPSEWEHLCSERQARHE
jgi:hypothetical protein